MTCYKIGIWGFSLKAPCSHTYNYFNKGSILGNNNLFVYLFLLFKSVQLPSPKYSVKERIRRVHHSKEERLFMCIVFRKQKNQVMVRTLYFVHWATLDFLTKNSSIAIEKKQCWTSCSYQNNKMNRTCLASFPPKGTDNWFRIVQCSESNMESFSRKISRRTGISFLLFVE